MVMPTAMPCRIGAAFGFERQVLCFHDEVHGAQHVGQHMVGLDLEVVGLQFDGHMAVAQVVGGACQVKRCAMVGAVGDDQHGLRRRNHAHQRAVFGYQHIAAAHQGAARQKNAQFAPGRIGGRKTAFLANVPVEFDRGGTLEQNGCKALAMGDEFGDLDH